MIRKFDLCVIGGGPAGLAAALRAVDFNKSVCLIESKRIGGVDFWDGALQSKTLWELSKTVATLNDATRKKMLGIPFLPPLEHSNILKTLTDAAETREIQMLKQLETTQIELIKGVGSFVDPRRIKVSTEPDHLIEADYFVIATGTVPRPHPTIVEDGDVVLSSDSVMKIDFPKSLVVIGAGVIGCEFASIFANFNMTKVHVIEKAKRILPAEDADIALFIQDLLEKKNVTVHNKAAIEGVEKIDNHIKFKLKNLDTSEVTVHEVDKALVSIGRIPDYKLLHLDNLPDHKIGQKGKLERDCYYRVTPYKHIYACGDAVTDVALVNVGELEGRSCVEHIYGMLPEEHSIISLDNLSTIMFLDQEVAAVGLSEKQCRAKGIAYKAAKYSYEFVERCMAKDNVNGFVKLVVTNDAEMKVLGVRAIGSHASSIIELGSLAIHNKQSLYDLSQLNTAHCAITQGFQDCLCMLLGTSIFKPNVFPGLIITEWAPSNSVQGRAYL